MKTTQSTAIIGGGIGGLTCALALHQFGLQSVVYEAAVEAVEARESGAGIWVSPNAMQVFDRLGLVEDICRAGYELMAIELLDYKDGSLASVPLTDVKAKYGHGILAIKRARLREILAQTLEERTAAGRAKNSSSGSDTDSTAAVLSGYRCLDARQEDDKVLLSFANGKEIEANSVVAADGLHSIVRQKLFPKAGLRYSGQTSWRAVVAATLPEKWTKTSVEIWGEGRRFGFSYLSEKHVYWYATADMPALRRGEQDDKNAQEQLRKLFVAFPQVVRKLIAAALQVEIIRTDIYDLSILPRWYVTNIALLGDAAHATTPNLGQGGAQAIEDAYVLAKMLSQHDQPSVAFEQYQDIRQTKARKIVRTSRLIGRLAHLRGPVPRAVRNALFKLAPPSTNLNEMESLYRLDF